MDNKHNVEITTRDLVLLAWEDSMELVRDFESYSKQIRDDDEAAQAFAQFAEEEGIHASKFRELLHKYEK